VVKTTVKMDMVFQKQFNKVRKETAQVMISMVEAEFADLLLNAPQFSGNFVANMAIASGSALGRKGGEKVFATPKSNQQAFERGKMPAVMHAWNNVGDIRKNLTAHITKSAGYLTSVTIYNKLPDAELIEGLSASDLRDVNKEGAHAMAKFEINLQSRFNTNVEYGSGNWYSYLEAKYL